MDHLNTPRFATNAQGQIAWRWEGEAFGATPPSLANVTINLRFPGQYFDDETKVHYNHWRYYRPDVGRYLRSDPIGLLGGSNSFGYAGQNSLTYIDPTGLLFRVIVKSGV